MTWPQNYWKETKENWNWQAEAEQSCSASRLQTTTTAFSQNSHLATPDIGKAQGIQIHSLILIKNQHDTASGPTSYPSQTAIHERKKSSPNLYFFISQTLSTLSTQQSPPFFSPFIISTISNANTKLYYYHLLLK